MWEKKEFTMVAWENKCQKPCCRCKDRDNCEQSCWDNEEVSCHECKYDIE